MRPDEQQREWASGVLAVLAATAGVFGRFGYAYGRGDHDDVLAPVLRRLDPSLFAADAFVLSQDGMTVRTAFQGVLAGLSHLFPLPLVVGTLYMVVLAAVAAGAYRLGRTVLTDRLGAALGVVIALVVVPRWTLGGNSLVGDALLPESAGWAFALPAYALAADRQWLKAAVLLGLAAWFHPLVGLLSAGALGLVALWDAAASPDGRRALGEAVRFGVVFGAVASVFVLPALLRQSAEAGAALPGGLSGYEFYALWRFPHHYLPTTFGAGRWLRFLALLAAGGAGLFVCAQTGRLARRDFVLRLGVVVAVLCVIVGTVAVAADSLAAARLQVFKLTLPITVLLSLGVGGALAAAVPRSWRSVRIGATLAAAFAVAACVRGASRVHTESPEAAVWAEHVAPTDALFLVPPSATWFRVHAERSVLATWKAVPFRLDLAADWLQRHRTQASAAFAADPTPPLAALDDAYNTAEGWPEATRQFGADYAVRATGVGAPAPYRIAFQGDEWTVYDLHRPLDR